MGEAAGIAAELDLVEQLSCRERTLRPTARQIIDEIAGRSRALALWRGAPEAR